MDFHNKTQADYVYECLVATQKPMTTREIVNWICDNFPDYVKEKLSNCRQKSILILNNTRVS